jgi:HSP20 family molecular chaperone IbpA
MKNEVTKTKPEVQNELPLVAPRVDVYEGDSQAMVIAELPGVAKENLDIKVEKGNLTIAARSETVRYERSFVIHESVDPDGIEAHYSNGLLRLKLPLRAPRTQQIEVKAA